jgi:hypothetical protein
MGVAAGEKGRRHACRERRAFIAILAAATDVVGEQIPPGDIESFARKVPILRESD